ncbi:hypothetical protein A3D23_02475 [candidate division WOR-1 bacterium RIFCSPHIGHO2_02_FULL_53_26]|nr:MAG: hypothetical protein A3D23_02475 [candidate division WOR-1 bacterium RIFCSPHIGHO2_02_FULL_53_26]
MEQTVLNTDQIVALNAAAGESRLSGYYLSGGTALAEYYLRHRISDDLDFFIYDEPDSIFLPEFAEKLKALLRSSSIRFERLHDRYQFYFSLHDRGELKIEFARYHFKSLLEPRNINGVRIDSFRDIAANKLMAMLDRFDPKDFIDLYYIIQQTSLDELRQDAEKKFGIKIGGVFLGGELGKARRIEVLPKMLKPLKVEELKAFFSEQARKLAPEVLF